MTASTPGRSMQACRSVEAKGIFHFVAKSFTPSSVRPATETTCTSLTFASAFTWISPIAPVPARQIFIVPPADAGSCFPRPARSTQCTSTPIQAHRVVDEQLTLQFRCPRNVWHVVNEEPIIGHVVLEIRVWPVGAPEHSIGKCFDESPGKRNHVAIGVPFAVDRGRSRDRQSLGAADFRPDIFVLAQHADEQLEFGAVDRFADIGSTHVIHHHSGWKRGEEVPEFRKIRGFEVDDDVPAKWRDPMCDLSEHVARREVDEAFDEVEARAADAGLVHRCELGVGHRSIDGRDAACAAVGGEQRVNECPIVGAVTGRLNDDVLIEAEMIAESEELVLRGIARRVLALRRVRKLIAGPEYMTMRVDGAGRDFEHRYRRVWVNWQPAWGYFELHIGSA